MSTVILDGKLVRESKIEDLANGFASLLHKPTLAIIQIGHREDSSSFIKAKINFAGKIGVEVRHINLEEDVSQAEVIKTVKKCNADDGVQGIIVQLPLPLSLDQYEIIDSIDPVKDCDGLTSFNVKRALGSNDGTVLSATTRGVKELLEYYKVDLNRQHVVVVGRSMLVGKPLAAFALNENATVTICHSQTSDLPDQTKKADVLIVAVGRPKLIKADHIREGTTVIDIGINTVKGEKLEDEILGRKLVGDVDFQGVKQLCKAITPVPGGVGPMTVLALFENLLDLCKRY